jgi:3-oxoacyl-[acyl-carrier protein] reductase
VLVTGGNRGIGLAIARAFAANGDNVAVTHRGSGAPDGLFGVQCDVTSADEVDAAFKAVEAEFGSVQVLVANAGMTDDTLLLRMSEESFTSVVDANLAGAYRVAKRAASGMLRKRGGRMIFISSVVALVGAPGQANYAASKAGLIGLTQALAAELAPDRIRVNLILPGAVDTQMYRDMNSIAGSRASSGGPHALKRVAAPEELARSILLLVSDDSSFVSGSLSLADEDASVTRTWARAWTRSCASQR